MAHVTVIGAGLAGSEAAWQAANRGAKVTLYEMRPVQMTPAHHTDRFAELVCTNSLRSNSITNAVGLLKEEMRRLDSVIMRAADAHAVPAGNALAVDRDGFSQRVTELVHSIRTSRSFAKKSPRSRRTASQWSRPGLSHLRRCRKTSAAWWGTAISIFTTPRR